jgi:hypothetical protein
MKRREMIVATSGLAAAFALGCSDGMMGGGSGGAPGSGGVGSGGGPGSGGAGTGGGPGTGGGGGSGGSGASGGDSSGGTTGSGGAQGSGGAGSGGGPGSGGGGGSGGSGASGASGGSGGAECSAPTAEDDNTLHQHVLTVLAADVEAGVDKTYTVSMAGQGPHGHEVLVTAANFATLASTGTVTVPMIADSTGHTHNYTIECA